MSQRGNLESENFDRQVLYKSSLVAFIDKSAKMGLILDYSSRLILAINGRHSSLIVIDVSAQVRYYLENEADTVNSIWANFNTYFRKLSSLRPLLKTGKEKGEKSMLGNMKKTLVDKVLDEIFNSLGGSSSFMEKGSPLTEFMERLRGPLIVMYRFGSFNISMELNKFTELNLVVAELLDYSDEDFRSDISLNGRQIFTTRSGAEVVLRVLSQIGRRSDLAQLFDGLFQSPEKVGNLLLSATSGSHDGLDGLITILVDYVGVFNGNSSIIRLISSVLSYNPLPGLSLGSLVNQTLIEVANQNKRYENAPAFSIYTSILKGLIIYDYTDNNISLSDIITLLAEETRNSSNQELTIVKLLSSFYPTSTIPHFFGSILKQLNWTVDGAVTPENSTAKVFYSRPIIAFISEPARMAVIIDYSSRLMVLFNGNQSSIIVIDLSEQVVYYLEDQAEREDSFWADFRGYILKLSSLQSFLETGQTEGKKSELNALEGPVLRDLEEVSKSLGASLPIPEELSLHIELIEQLRGPLYEVYRGPGSFEILSGGDAFIKVNLEMAKMLTGSKD